jgi:hypothetical protein
MVRVRVTCALRGLTFSPSLAERTTGLPLERKLEPGESDRLHGRGKSGGGRAEVVVQEYGAMGELVTKNAGTLSALGRSVEALRRAGATDLTLRLDVEYEGPAQFEIPADLIRRLGELGLPVVIGVFAKDETQDLGARGGFLED